MKRIILICVSILFIPFVGYSANKELYKAFAFGKTSYTRTVYNDASQSYIKIVQNGGNFMYTAGQGYGYTDIDAIDASPNDRNLVPCGEELLDQFIGISGGGDLKFRVDLPNGDYQFVAIIGDPATYGAKNGSLYVQDGDAGSTITLMENVNVLAGEYAAVGFDDKVHLPCTGATIAEQPESPVLTVTNGYIDIIQSSVDKGSDLIYIEIWEVDNEVFVSGVNIDQNGPVTIEPGASTTLTATVSPENASNKSISWSSSNSSIASVSSAGQVTGLAEGSVTITVTTADGGHTDNILVNVDCPEIIAPQNFIASAGSEQVTLVWDPVEGADSYTILYGISSGGPYSSVIVPQAEQTTKTISGLSNETSYYFVIQASKTICEGLQSDEISAKPSAFINEYYGQNVYISTVESGKNLGSGILAVKSDGEPDSKKGFGPYKPVSFVVQISAPNAEEGLNACLTMSFEPDNLPEGVNLATLVLFKSDDNGITWSKIGGITDFNENTITFCGIDSFSQWTIAGSVPPDVPLSSWGIFMCFLFTGALFLRKK